MIWREKQRERLQCAPVNCSATRLSSWDFLMVSKLTFWRLIKGLLYASSELFFPHKSVFLFDSTTHTREEKWKSTNRLLKAWKRSFFFGLKQNLPTTTTKKGREFNGTRPKAHSLAHSTQERLEQKLLSDTDYTRLLCMGCSVAMSHDIRRREGESASMKTNLFELQFVNTFFWPLDQRHREPTNGTR